MGDDRRVGFRPFLPFRKPHFSTFGFAQIFELRRRRASDRDLAGKGFL
jgi:hypothetical protein